MENKFDREDESGMEGFMGRIRETLINWLHERITSLRGTYVFAYLVDMSQLLRSGRLVLHLVRRINQCFLSMSKIAVVRHPRVFLSRIQNFSQLETGFPIRIVSGMTGALNTDLLRVSA
ncbi:hypothetical protein SAMN05216406_10392 [Nitrosomonas ureae]|uniref:Uncharacterized protein n=1 Tax=Nitrosomonas ureae TaxID=44577 RepID=A0A1H2DQN4_9PROT|nr:hypothetical protein SAMN05216406_10392 [Nitrosomonas ureae]